MAGSSLPNSGGREVSAEGYLMYSCQVLESLYRADPSLPVFDKGAVNNSSAQRVRADTLAQAREQVVSCAPGELPAPARRANTDAYARVREQFSGAKMLHPPPHASGMPETFTLGGRALERSVQQANADALARAREQFSSGTAMLPPVPSSSVGAPAQPPQPISKHPLELNRVSDLMNMSIGSVSLSQLFEARGSYLERLSTLQREETEADMHVDREVSVAFDDGRTPPYDRVSELRSTEMSMNPGRYRPLAPTDFQDARNSLMDASIMSFGTEDMSIRPCQGENQRLSTSTGESNERETAEQLMRLSTDVKHENSH